MNLTRAEKRALVLSYKTGITLPNPDSITASLHVSRASTLDSLCDKGLLVRSPYRGLTYFFTDRAVEIARTALSAGNPDG